MMFLHGQKIAKSAALLLPQRLHAANASTLSVPAYEYTCFDDVSRGSEQWNPRIVILMTGYLFSNNKLLSRGNLRKLVQHLRATRRHVLTTDPFLGLTATLSPHDVQLGLPESSPNPPRGSSEPATVLLPSAEARARFFSSRAPDRPRSRPSLADPDRRGPHGGLPRS